MKPNFKILIAIFLIFYISVFVKIIKDGSRSTQYCGHVTSMYRQEASYKRSAEAHVIFYCDSLKRKVDVEVSNNTFANTNVGQPICFKLSKNDLKD